MQTKNISIGTSVQVNANGQNFLGTLTLPYRGEDVQLMTAFGCVHLHHWHVRSVVTL